MKGKTGANEEKKEAYVLIKVKPKYVEEFCIRMVACRGLCNRISKSKNLAEIDEVFSVLGPYDFLLELSGEGESDEEKNKKINRTIFKIRETLGNYIDETCTLTQFELSEFLEKDDKCLFIWDNVFGKGNKSKMLPKFFADKFNIGWAENIKILEHADDKTTCIKKGENSAEMKIDEKNGKATLTISDGGTYDRTYGLKVKDNGKLKIYEHNPFKLFEKAKSLETKIKEDGELNDFRTFLEKKRTFFDGLVNLQQDLKCDTVNIENLWKKNTYLFSLKLNCKKYLKDGSVGVELKKEFDGEFKKKHAHQYRMEFLWNCRIERESSRILCVLRESPQLIEHVLKKKFDGKKQSLSDKAKVYEIDAKNWKIVDDMKRYGIYDTGTELKVYKIMTKDVHVLIKVKPAYTEEFFVAMNVLKSLCNRAPSSQSLAVIDEVCSMLGPYDFLLELSGVGDDAEKKDKTINKTILKIRETLGGYIYETLTIEKFKIPMKKEELEKLFEKILEEKTLAKLPGIDGEKIPDEDYKSDEDIDLEDIYNAETTSLRNLLKRPKTFLELENLNERIDDLDDRVEELEKKKKKS